MSEPRCAVRTTVLWPNPIQSHPILRSAPRLAWHAVCLPIRSAADRRSAQLHHSTAVHATALPYTARAALPSATIAQMRHSGHSASAAPYNSSTAQLGRPADRNRLTLSRFCRSRCARQCTTLSRCAPPQRACACRCWSMPSRATASPRTYSRLVGSALLSFLRYAIHPFECRTPLAWLCAIAVGSAERS